MGDHREVGPDRAVEQVLLNRRYHGRDAANREAAPLSGHDDVVREERDPTDVVEVGMRDEDRPDPHLLLLPENGGERPRVEEYLVVEEKGRGVAPGILCARAS